MPGEYTEDQLVQKTTADYLRDVLGWDSVYAYNVEELGIDGTLGRESQPAVVLVRHLRQALVELNSGLPDAAYDDAGQQIAAGSISKSMVQRNQEKYTLFLGGSTLGYRLNWIYNDMVPAAEVADELKKVFSHFKANRTEG